ncbi:hypothetical protein I317_02929 [Kwoniella heveanensis CBS 569]|nr:hypothetical protein I317_02929 [Kwoniella heveanensis CBS 569]
MRYHRCTSCGKHLCFTHAFRPHHKCLYLSEDEAEEAEARVNGLETINLIKAIKNSNIADVASSLRNGIPCVLNIPENLHNLMEGGINVLIPVVFEDGHRWLARVKQQNNQPPLDSYNRAIAESEVETLKVLREHGLKVPAAYLPAKGDTDQSQLCYFFVDIVDGTPMNPPLHNDDDSEEKQKKVLYQLAKFNIELSQFTFPAVGSLYPSSNGSLDSHVGPIVSTSICEETPPHFLGPFRTNQDKYLAAAGFVLRKILNGVLCPDDPLPIYLWHLELMEIIRDNDNWQDDGQYYLKHGDDKGDHIMADEEGNITALIDWEWAYTTTKAEAFSTPFGCLALELLTEDGKSDLQPNELALSQAYEQLGRPDLAECARSGRFYHWLKLGMGHEPYIELINGIRETTSHDTYGYDTIEDWVEEMKLKFGADKGLQALLGRDRE